MVSTPNCYIWWKELSIYLFLRTKRTIVRNPIFWWVGLNYLAKSNHISRCKNVQNTKVLNFAHFNPKNTHINTCKNVQIYTSDLQMNNYHDFWVELWCVFVLESPFLSLVYVCVCFSKKKKKKEWAIVPHCLRECAMCNITCPTFP